MTKHALFAIAAALVFTGAGVAQAQTAEDKAVVDAAKAQGVVGETGEGLLAFVSETSDPALRAAVSHINAGRTEAFKAAAAKAGVTVEAAGQAAARQIYDRLPSGAYFKPLGGSWTRKP